MTKAELNRELRFNREIWNERHLARPSQLPQPEQSGDILLLDPFRPRH